MITLGIGTITRKAMYKVNGLKLKYALCRETYCKEINGRIYAGSFTRPMEVVK